MKSSIKFFLLGLIGILPLLFGCGGGGGESGPDTTPPVVSIVSPANGATNVPTTSTVSVTFNEAMNSSTINATTFTVTAGGTPVAGAISSSGTTYTFTPSGSLATDTLHTVTVTTGATDVAGNAMAANFTSSFTTVSVPVTVDVSIGDNFFTPQSITIKVGDTVRWTNNGAALHTTTSGTSPTANGIWGSAILASGESFSFTFTQAGIFPYFCSVHPGIMTGTVTVQ
ncbi:MAG: Ig-like domain-containing protein [Betaproteobacteria bacterium]|nr:Ig-like domain-containing protein [Betaproteobacteria bacterium]MDH3468844.1 Ig-like domain-containing protein [Gammaproteobacteria bacterium]